MPNSAEPNSLDVPGRRAYAAALLAWSANLDTDDATLRPPSWENTHWAETFDDRDTFDATPEEVAR